MMVSSECVLVQWIHWLPFQVHESVWGWLKRMNTNPSVHSICDLHYKICTRSWMIMLFQSTNCTTLSKLYDAYLLNVFVLRWCYYSTHWLISTETVFLLIAWFHYLPQYYIETLTNLLFHISDLWKKRWSHKQDHTLFKFMSYTIIEVSCNKF